MSQEDFDKCVLCSEDAADTSDESESERFFLYEDRRALKAVLYELFHHIQIPHQDIPHAFRLCRHARFCLRCMEMLESIWSMQMSIAKSQILVQNTAESLGRLIAAAPLVSVQKGLQAKRSKRDRDLWALMRNPVIQNFAKDLLPLPRVVLSDFVEEKKRKRRLASEHNYQNDQKDSVDGKMLKCKDAGTGLLDEVSGASKGNLEDEVARNIGIGSPEMLHSSPQMRGTKRMKTDDDAQTLQTSDPLKPCAVQASISTTQVSQSMNSTILSSTTQVSQSFPNGLPLPLGQPYPAPGHAVFVSYVPLEAFKEKSNNFGAFGSPSLPPTNSQFVTPNIDASETSMGNPVGPDLSCKSATVEVRVTSVSSVSPSDLTQEFSTEKMPEQILRPRNKSDMESSCQDVVSEVADPDAFHIQQAHETNVTEGNITNPTDISTPKCSPGLLSVRCPKCDFQVEEMTKEKSLQRIYVHYGKEHLDVDKEDPCVSEDGLEYFICQLCPYKSFIIDYSINTRRSSSMGKRQYAIVSLASHCIGVHEPMIQTSVIQAQRSPVRVSQHQSQYLTCPANKCDFKVDVRFDGKSVLERKKRNGVLRMGYHYLKSHAFPDFPMLDIHHPCYQKSGEKSFFKCPFCSESYVEHPGGKNARQNASRRFIHHLAKSHVLKGQVKSSLMPLQLEFQCQECDSVIHTTRQNFRRPSDAKCNLRRQLRKHYLEIHNRKTIPFIDNDAAFFKQSEVYSRKDSRIAPNANSNGEVPEELSYLRRIKCPLCSFTSAEKENPRDPESRFRILVLHFITHIPVGPSDSTEQNDDGMICVRNLYTCDQCPFMSRARTEGSSMTDLHEELAEHYLRFHYANNDNMPPVDSPMSDDEDCDNGRAYIPREVNEKDVESDECSLYSESMEYSLEDDVKNSIKVEDRSSCSNWDMAEFEDVEVFNVTEVENSTGTRPPTSSDNCASDEFTATDPTFVRNHAESPASTSADNSCIMDETTATGPIVAGNNAESPSTSSDYNCTSDETTATDPTAVGNNAESSSTSSDYNCASDETTATDPTVAGNNAESSSTSSNYNCTSTSDETTATDPTAVGNNAESPSTSSDYNCARDETTATDPTVTGSNAETPSTSSDYNCVRDETTATDPTVAGNNAETPTSPNHSCANDDTITTYPYVSEETTVTTTALTPTAKLTSTAVADSFQEIRETFGCENYEWDIVDTTTTEDESS